MMWVDFGNFELKMYSIDHFRVTLYLCFKQVLVQNLSYGKEFDLHENEPVGELISLFEWFRTKTRFETEAKANSEIAY